MLASVSPQKMKVVSAGRSSEENSGFARHMSANEGVDTQMFTSLLARARSRPTAPWDASCVRLNRLPPAARAPASSKTERSNENGAWSKKTQPSLSVPPRTRSQSQKLSKHAAVTSTPLGAPVEPDVNSTYAKSSPQIQDSRFETLPDTAAAQISSASITCANEDCTSAVLPSTERSSSPPTCSAIDATRAAGTE